jgi:hypothetical protein
VAYLKARQAGEAVAEFQRVQSLSPVAPADILMPFSRLGLARSYVLLGDASKAKSAYQDVLALWKDADPDLSIVREAKAEYAKLQ